MKSNKVLTFALIIAVMFSAVALFSVSGATPIASAAAPSAATSETPAGVAHPGQVSLVHAYTPDFTGPVGSGGDVADPEFPQSFGPDNSPQGGSAHKQVQLPTNRSLSRQNAPSSPSVAAPVTGANAIAPYTGLTTFEGLNHFQNRFEADNGNQFSLEPPDGGLCANASFVMETVNDVLRIYSPSGAPVTVPISLNKFYGYPSAINRSTRVYGPFVTDPSCYYDPDTQRWFHVVLTLDTNPSNGAFTGGNHLDIAVSQTPDPTGTWNIYKVSAEDNGTNGQPDHGCSVGYCIGDYPQIGADKYGFYITTNEYSLFGPEFKTAQLYAFSKRQLAAGASSVFFVHYDNLLAGGPAGNTFNAFTIRPAVSPAAIYETARGGTEYMLSSDSGEEANGVPGGSSSNEIIFWALSHTRALDVNGVPNLAYNVIRSELYVEPVYAEQKAEQGSGGTSNLPLGQCLRDITCGPPLFRGAYNPATVEGKLNPDDTRMMQTVFAEGKVTGALNTFVNVGGLDKDGIAYFSVNPHNVAPYYGTLYKQGYVAAANNNVMYPATTLLPTGKGEMGVTLVGTDYYPSAAYVDFDLNLAVPDHAIHIAHLGDGPQDGFSEYPDISPRPRWGDYATGVVVGHSIWLANEDIHQTCTYDEWLGSNFRCGNTRTLLANWSNQITRVVIP